MPRILFVPGLAPKPEPAQYHAQLVRVLLASLSRASPAAAEWLAAHRDRFVVVAWSYEFYRTYRDIALDLPGIERLLAEPTPSAEDRRELCAPRRRWLRWVRRAGDTWPVLAWFASSTTRSQLRDAQRYLADAAGMGTRIRSLVHERLEDAWDAGDRVLLIGHSLGSVICYDVLYEASRRAPDRRVELFVTIGSPLATRFFRGRLLGADRSGPDRYPRNVRRWVNLAARGDLTALEPRLEPHFRPMVEHGLVESIEDHVDLDNCFRTAAGINAHEIYGYFTQPVLAKVVAEFIEHG